jgi:hypothetical protein
VRCPLFLSAFPETFLSRSHARFFSILKDKKQIEATVMAGLPQTTVEIHDGVVRRSSKYEKQRYKHIMRRVGYIREERRKWLLGWGCG